MKLKTLAISLVLIVILIGRSNSTHAQSKIIPIITQTGDTLNIEYRMRYSIIVDGDSLNEVKMTQSSIELPVPDSLLQVSIFGNQLQTFYNEYTPSQLAKLSNIEVYFSHMISVQTPHFFKENILHPSESIEDSLDWFKSWLNEHTEIRGYEVYVYQSRGLTGLEKRKVKKLHRRIEKTLGYESNLVFKNEPYTTSQKDCFKSGESITMEFIESQNTPNMKNRAENYSMVLVFIILWGGWNWE